MSAATRLVVRSRPGEGETLHGFLLRLSELNGYAGTRTIRELTGLPPTFAAVPCGLERLDAVLGGPAGADALAGSACWPGRDGLIGVGRARLSPALIDLARARVCPACLAEGLRERPAWDVRLVTACSRHGVRLVDACTACDRPLRWGRARLTDCDCGSSITSHATIRAGDGARLMSATLEGEVGGADLPPGLRLPALGDALGRLAWFVGTAADAGSDWRTRYIAKPDVTETESIMETAAAVLVDWPSGVGVWLDRIRHVHGPLGLTRTVARIRQSLEGVQYAEFLSAVSRHVEAFPEAPRKGWTRSIGVGAGQTWIDATRAAGRLGTTAGRVADMIEAGELTGSSSAAGGRRRLLISSDSVTRLADRFASAIPAREAAARLGVSRHALEDLRGAGLLPYVRPPRLGGIARAYLPDDLDALADRVACMATAAGPSEPTSLFRMSLARSRRLSEVLRGILTGTFPVHAIAGVDDRPPFERLGVDPAKVRGIRLDADDVPTLDVARTARALRVSTRMVPVLVRAGCLSATGGSRLGRNSVDSRSVRDFPDRFVMARTLAARHTTSTKVVVRLLAAAGVSPVVPSNASDGISAVWLRTDIEAARGVPWPRRRLRRTSARKIPSLTRRPGETLP